MGPERRAKEKEMVRVRAEYFSIRQICESGQCFRLERLEKQASEGEDSPETNRERAGSAGLDADGEESYALCALGRYLEIRQNGDEIFFDCTRQEFEKVWKNYFDLDEDYGKIIASIDRQDAWLTRAAAHGSGIRILRQDLWEMIVSFLISQQNNIRRIRRCIDLLCKTFGEEKRTKQGRRYYDFPGAQALAAASPEELRACNLGYRSRYIHETAGCIARGEADLAQIRALPHEQARQELMKLCGVGVKVAECVCLFGLHHTQAFPVDVHMDRVLAGRYPQGFPFEQYQKNAGIMQQYLFYYDLKKGGEKESGI